MSEEATEHDLDYVTKKLGLSHGCFQRTMRASPWRHQEFEIERSVYEMYPILKPFRGTVNQLKRLITS